MKKGFSSDFAYSVATLFLCIIVVQAVYALHVRPHAEAIIAERNAIMQSHSTKAPPSLRSIYVILHDYEAETAIILGCWAFCLIAFHGRAVRRERALLERDFLHLAEGQVLLAEDVRTYSRPIEALPAEEQNRFLPRTLSVALNRFGATRSVQDAASAVIGECEFESSRLNADLSMVRFVVWAIPAVGFVGTVRGIGQALQEAQRALTGDISGVTLGLGITFNCTLVALTFCIAVMFWLHQLQQAQDQLVLDTKTYVDRRLIRNLRAY